MVPRCERAVEGTVFVLRCEEVCCGLEVECVICILFSWPKLVCLFLGFCDVLV